MKVKKLLSCAIDGLIFGYFDAEKEEFIPIELKESALKEAAMALGISAKFLEAMDGFVEMLREDIHEDLMDLWEEIHKEDEE